MEQLKQLFSSWAGEPCLQCLQIGAGGSSRRYFRLIGHSKHCIGTLASDKRENEAFFAFTRHFLNKGMPVPQLYLVADDRLHYLQQDLGDISLYGLLHSKKQQGRGFDAEMLAYYRTALSDLAAIQMAGRDLDFSFAYPRQAFDRQSILWDLNYFKYFFLKLNHLDFDEQLLEDDFHHLADLLLTADCNYFLYRDFQGRNIMVDNGKLYYIDYQGGRRGATQYDVASLLYSAKSNLPQPLRLELLNHYIDARQLKQTARQEWLNHFWPYVYIRILQTLGAYGYRGIYERKEYFLQSIPPALANLRLLTETHPLNHLPELQRALSRAAALQPPTDNSPLPATNSPLTISILSFSYKKGLPPDNSGNGGGFVFDCRALPNPGRYPEYKTYTGKDRPVIQFLEREPAVDLFLSNVKKIVTQSVDKYLERHFSHLQVAFGCTGGQHRSVYCAEQLAASLATHYNNIIIDIKHCEQS